MKTKVISLEEALAILKKRKSEDGIDKLDAICMMLIAIGEGLKNIDKVTSGKLLSCYSDGA